MQRPSTTVALAATMEMLLVSVWAHPAHTYPRPGLTERVSMASDD